MGLFIRMILYAVSAFVGGYEFATFDEAAGTLTLDLEGVGLVIGAGLTFVGTFIASRWAKARGGKT